MYLLQIMLYFTFILFNKLYFLFYALHYSILCSGLSISSLFSYSFILNCNALLVEPSVNLVNNQIWSTQVLIYSLQKSWRVLQMQNLWIGVREWHKWIYKSGEDKSKWFLLVKIWWTNWSCLHTFMWQLV